MAYISRRFYAELHFYSNPIEAFKILGDPSTTISMARRVANFGEQLTLNPTERYVRGDNKGDLKLIRKGMKTLPVFGMIDRNIQESYEWLESN